jgi:hypothetical protein
MRGLLLLVLVLVGIVATLSWLVLPGPVGQAPVLRSEVPAVITAAKLPLQQEARAPAPTVPDLPAPAASSPPREASAPVIAANAPPQREPRAPEQVPVFPLEARAPPSTVPDLPAPAPSPSPKQAAGPSPLPEPKAPLPTDSILHRLKKERPHPLGANRPPQPETSGPHSAASASGGSAPTVEPPPEAAVTALAVEPPPKAAVPVIAANVPRKRDPRAPEQAVPVPAVEARAPAPAVPDLPAPAANAPPPQLDADAAVQEAQTRLRQGPGRPSEPSRPPVSQPITVDEALAHLRAANVAFNTPDQARVGKQFVVEAKLSTHLLREDMSVLIEEPGKREVATLKVSDRMAATLSGGSAFEVSPSGPKEQWISDQELTEWDWQVSPRSVGDQVLILSFDAVISLNGREDRRTINTFKRRITVAVGWPQTGGEWLDFIRKTGENVSWIWVTLLIPIGGGLWALIKHRAWPAWPSKPTESDLS